jgi:hypothetical protein
VLLSAVNHCRHQHKNGDCHNRTNNLPSVHEVLSATILFRQGAPGACSMKPERDRAVT